MLKRKSIFDIDPLEDAVMRSTSVRVEDGVVMLRYSTTPPPEIPSAKQLLSECFDSSFLTEQLLKISGRSLDGVEQCTDRILEILYSGEVLSKVEDALRDLIPDPLGHKVELDKLQKHIDEVQDEKLKAVLMKLFSTIDIETVKQEAIRVYALNN